MNIVGHERMVSFLKKVLERKMPIHGFLFHGPDGVGKKFVAFEFAKGVLCETTTFGGCGKCVSCREFQMLGGAHRDFLFLKPTEEEPYGIDTSRAVKTFLSSRPQLAQKQVVIADQADELTEEAQNALLKIFEEPPVDAIIILVSAKPSRIRETIRSRAVPVAFRLVADKEIEHLLKLCETGKKKKLSEEERAKVVKFALGRPGRAVAFYKNPDRLKEEEKLLRTLRTLPYQSLPDRFLFAKEFAPRSHEVFPLWHLVIRDQILAGIGLADLAVIPGKSPVKEVMPLADAVMLLRRAVNAGLAIESSSASPRLIIEGLLLTIPSSASEVRK